MADDVKIKFGGDFEDVSKGASSAVGKAGASLGSWFSDFSKSTEASILSALSLAAVFGKVTESMSQVMKYSRGIDDAFKRFGSGSNAEEFQLIARYGDELGVSMEAVGRTMNYFAKVQESAKKGNESHKSALMGLNFTEKEAMSGRISAIEVLRRMSDEYDRTGNAALSGQRAVQLFGLQGEQLSAIYKNGKLNIDEFTKSVTAMDKSTLEATADADRRIERYQRKAKDVFSTILKINDFLSPGPGGIDPSTGKYVPAFRMREIEKEKQAEAEKKRDKTGGPPLLETVRVMATSSLQSIGGGDVNSILSGTYQSSMLDAATKTADNTGKLLDKENNKPAIKPTNVAK